MGSGGRVQGLMGSGNRAQGLMGSGGKAQRLVGNGEKARDSWAVEGEPRDSSSRLETVTASASASI